MILDAYQKSLRGLTVIAAAAKWRRRSENFEAYLQFCQLRMTPDSDLDLGRGHGQARMLGDAD